MHFPANVGLKRRTLCLDWMDSAIGTPDGAKEQGIRGGHERSTQGLSAELESADNRSRGKVQSRYGVKSTLNR